MSINAFNPQPGRENQFIVGPGEQILRRDKSISLSFKNQSHACHEMKGSKKGKIFLTNWRILFLSDSAKDPLRDFSIPFSVLSKIELKQPMFGSNYILGSVKAAPGGGWEGTTEVEISFNAGGAIEFGQLVLKTANTSRTEAPSYSAQGGDTIYPVPPPMYNSAAATGTFDPNTGMYHFPAQSSAPPPNAFNDAPPRYEDLQSNGYGVVDQVQRKNQ